MSNLNIKIDSKKFEDFINKFENEGLRNILLFSIRKTSSFLSSFIIQKHLTGGTTSNKLATKSGRLKQSTIESPLKISGSMVKGGITFGTKYAGVHISDRPISTTITPKTAKNLAIPLPGSPALGAGGVPRFTGSIKQAFPFLSFVVSSKGNKLLADTREGSFIPYFVLKKSVTIKSRVHLDEIVRNQEKNIIKIFNDAINAFVKRND